MRSKMLGLAIALVTFGLGIAATTLWIAYHTPKVQGRERSLAVRVDDPGEAIILGNGLRPCRTNKPSNTVTMKQPDYSWSEGTVLSKPTPSYPPSARAALVSGTVVVVITVDECGNVAEAHAISGHPLLRQAAVEAAERVKFSPPSVKGRPQSMVSTLAYNFILD